MGYNNRKTHKAEIIYYNQTDHLTCFILCNPSLPSPSLSSEIFLYFDKTIINSSSPSSFRTEISKKLLFDNNPTLQLITSNLQVKKWEQEIKNLTERIIKE